MLKVGCPRHTPSCQPAFVIVSVECHIEVLSDFFNDVKCAFVDHPDQAVLPGARTDLFEQRARLNNWVLRIGNPVSKGRSPLEREVRPHPAASSAYVQYLDQVVPGFRALVEDRGAVSVDANLGLVRLCDEMRLSPALTLRVPSFCQITGGRVAGKQTLVQ